MLRQRLWVLAVGLLFSGAVLRAEEGSDTIVISGHKAHATRIFAKHKQDGIGTGSRIRPAAFAKIASVGLNVRKEYSLVPGLLSLDEPKGGLTTAAILTTDMRIRRMADRIENLKASGLFEYVEPDFVVTANAAPDDLRFRDGTLWGLQNTGQDGGTAGADIDVVKAWDITTGTNSVVVAVIDTGIRYTHRDLAPNVWTNPGETPGNGIDDDKNGYVDDVHGINSLNGSGDPYDDNFHGTHVSGTIGAAANNGEPHVGVAWKVSLMGLKFLDANGSGFLSDAIECIQYAVKMKVPISNNSWGGGGADQALADAILAAGSAGHLFVASAGNASSNNDIEFTTPASYAFDNMISVAAINRKDQLADFSNFGNRTVHIGAPGVDIYSTWTSSDSSYDVISGTSMACPHVAGVAALVLSANPKANLFELRQRILNSAVPTAELAGKTITGGRVSAYRAVSGIVDGKLELSLTPPSGSALLEGNASPVYLRVTDLIAVTNATIVATINGPGLTDVPLVFTNNGVLPDVIALDATYSATFPAAGKGFYILNVIAAAKGKEGVTNSFSYTVQPRPDNDQFKKPKKIALAGEQLRSEDTRLSSFETGETSAFAGTDGVGSLWYAWTPAKSGSALIDTFGTGVPVAVGVFTGDNLNTLSQVAVGVPATPKTSTTFSFNAVGGTTYRIGVVGKGEAGRGIFRLRLTPDAVVDTTAPQVAFTSPDNGFIATTNLVIVSGIAIDPKPGASEVRQVLVNGQSAGITNGVWSAKVALKTGINTVTAVAQDFAENVSSSVSMTINLRAASVANDGFIAAAEIIESVGTEKGSNVNASREFGEPQHGGSEGGHSVWWRFTAPADGVLGLSTTTSTFDTLLGVYLGSTVDNLTLLASNDDEKAGSSTSAVYVALRSGQTARIAVDGFSGASGAISLTHSFEKAAVRAVEVIAGAGGSVSPSVSNAPGVLKGLYADGTALNLTAIADTRFEFIGWTGTIQSTDNPLKVVVAGSVNLTANFRAVPFTDDFESGDLKHLAWVTSGSAPWAVQTNTVSLGRFAAKAGTIADNQSSSLVVEANSFTGEGTFDLKVSSESGWDQLEFSVNGTVVQRWSGDVPWTPFTFPVPSGANRFEWRYTKDAVNSIGDDTAWLDNVQLRVRPEVDPTIPVVVSFLSYGDTGAQVEVRGQLGQAYQVQASNDFIQWTTISTKVNSTGTFTVTDSATFGRSERFYRVILAP